MRTHLTPQSNRGVHVLVHGILGCRGRSMFMPNPSNNCVERRLGIFDGMACAKATCKATAKRRIRAMNLIGWIVAQAGACATTCLPEKLHAELHRPRVGLHVGDL